VSKPSFTNYAQDQRKLSAKTGYHPCELQQFQKTSQPLN